VGSVALGRNSVAIGNNSTAIGQLATTSTFTNSTALGYSATATASNQVVLGTNTEAVYASGSTTRTPKVIGSGSIIINPLGVVNGVVNIATYTAPTGAYASAEIVAIVNNGDYNAGGQTNMAASAMVNSTSGQLKAYITNGTSANAARLNYIIYAI
jgi:hypothetical protein